MLEIVNKHVTTDSKGNSAEKSEQQIQQHFSYKIENFILLNIFEGNQRFFIQQTNKYNHLGRNC